MRAKVCLSICLNTPKHLPEHGSQIEKLAFKRNKGARSAAHYERSAKPAQGPAKQAGRGCRTVATNRYGLTELQRAFKLSLSY